MSSFAIRALHLCLHPQRKPSRPDLAHDEELVEEIGRLGHNTVVLEVDDGVHLRSHQELAHPEALPLERLGDLLATGQQAGLKVAPSFQTFALQECFLLRVHPELPKSPEQPYACYPSNPRVYEITSAVFQELVDLFMPGYFHMGHDEVVGWGPRGRRQIGACPRCWRATPSELFARDVMYYHGFLAKRGIETIMWGDMLLGPEWFPETAARRGRTHFGGEPRVRCPG